MTLRQHLEAAAQTSPEARADLEGPPRPPGVEGVWQLFYQLHATRTGSGFGPNPITFTEIASMTRMTGYPVATWEVDLIRAMDLAYLSASSEAVKAKSS